MHGVYLLWWVQGVVSLPPLSQRLSRQVTSRLTALEIPTGWLADRYGHRACLIAGSRSSNRRDAVAGPVSAFPDCSRPACSTALGDAFRSGADEALRVPIPRCPPSRSGF